MMFYNSKKIIYKLKLGLSRLALALGQAQAKDAEIRPWA